MEFVSGSENKGILIFTVLNGDPQNSIIQTVQADQTLQNAASNQGLHCLQEPKHWQTWWFDCLFVYAKKIKTVRFNP